LLGAAFDTVAQVGESELLTDPVEFGFEDFAADRVECPVDHDFTIPAW